MSDKQGKSLVDQWEELVDRYVKKIIEKPLNLYSSKNEIKDLEMARGYYEGEAGRLAVKLVQELYKASPLSKIDDTSPEARKFQNEYWMGGSERMQKELVAEFRTMVDRKVQEQKGLAREEGDKPNVEGVKSEGAKLLEQARAFEDAGGGERKMPLTEEEMMSRARNLEVQRRRGFSH